MDQHLRQQSERIASLGRKSPTEAERREVEEAASSKWEGIQVVAARALCSWGDTASLGVVRKLVESLARDRNRYSALGAVVSSLTPKLQEQDLEWALNLCFMQSNPHNRSWLTGLLTGLPPKRVLAALESRLDARGYDQKELRNAIHTVMNAEHTRGR